MNSKPISIEITDTKWIRDNMLGYGHYTYVISVTYNNNNNINDDNNISSNDNNSFVEVIERRYSDIEWLDINLKRLAAGCRIPKMPEKTYDSIKFNVGFNSKDELQKRKDEISNYLKFICQHKYLSESDCFREFLSKNFSKDNKNYFVDETKIEKLLKEIENSKKNNIINFATNYMPSIFMIGKKKKNYQNNTNDSEFILENDDELEISKQKFIRLKDGLDSLIKNIGENININKEKINSIQKIFNIMNKMKYTGVDYRKSNNNINSNLIDSFNESNNLPIQNNDVNKTEIEKLTSLLNNYYELKSGYYENKLGNNFMDKLYDYKNEIELIIEIYNRKNKRQEIFETIKNYKESINNNEEKVNDINESLRYLMKKMEEFNKELKEEINNFKLYKENDINVILKNFYQDKLNNDIEIDKLFNNNN
jgi:hypothetical protein